MMSCSSEGVVSEEWLSGWYCQHVRIAEWSDGCWKFKVNSVQCVAFRLPYVGEHHCDLESHVRSIDRPAFDDVNIGTVYSVRLAFTEMKDVLPTNLLRKVVYSFDYRPCHS